MEGGLLKWGICVYGSSVRGTRRRFEGLGEGTSFHEASLGILEGDSYTWGLCVEECSRRGVSPCRGHDGESREVGSSTRDFENWLNEGSGFGSSLSMRGLLGEP